MCQRRRWTAEQFRLFLVEHPLVRHLTRTFVMGGYTEENTLIACFRSRRRQHLQRCAG